VSVALQRQLGTTAGGIGHRCWLAQSVDAAIGTLERIASAVWVSLSVAASSASSSASGSRSSADGSVAKENVEQQAEVVAVTKCDQNGDGGEEAETAVDQQDEANVFFSFIFFWFITLMIYFSFIFANLNIILLYVYFR
jgi:hypothetical protein